MQARIGSTRLPGKILEDICGKPMIARVLDRIKKIQLIDNIVVATTTLPEDDILIELINNHDTSIGIYRGSINDVLDRYYKAAINFSANIIVRVTSDDPLIDPELCDCIIKAYFREKCDYCCNNMPRSYPLGLDVEVFSFETLKDVWGKAKEQYQREHVTPFIRENSGKYKIFNLNNKEDYSLMRWTVDTNEDLLFVRSIYERLIDKEWFSWKDVIKIIKREPYLLKINKDIKQKTLAEAASNEKNQNWK